MVPEPDPPDIAIEHERAVVDTENEQAAAYAAGLYQGQQVGYNPDAAAFDPDPDL